MIQLMIKSVFEKCLKVIQTKSRIKECRSFATVLPIEIEKKEILV